MTKGKSPIYFLLALWALAACQAAPLPLQETNVIAIPQVTANVPTVLGYRQQVLVRVLVPDTPSAFTVAQTTGSAGSSTTSGRKSLTPSQIRFVQFRQAVLAQDRVLSKIRVAQETASYQKQVNEFLRLDKLAVEKPKEFEPFIKEIERQREYTRKYAEAYAQQQLAANKKRMAEIDRQAKLVLADPKAAQLEAQKKAEANQEANRQRLAANQAKEQALSTNRIQAAVARAKQADDEYRKKVAELDRQAALTRKNTIEKEWEQYAKDEEAKLKQKGGKVPDAFTTKAVEATEDDFNLAYLDEGQLFFEATNGTQLPAFIQMKIDGFEQPITIPVLQKVALGQLVLSVERDNNGKTMMYGGFSSNSGLVDLARPMFTIRDEGQLVMDLVLPDGQRQRFALEQFSQITQAADEAQITPLQSTQLTENEWSQQRNLFENMLNFMPEPVDPLTNLTLAGE